MTSSSKSPLAPMPPDVSVLQKKHSASPDLFSDQNEFSVAGIAPAVGQYDLPVVVSSSVVEERQVSISLTKRPQQKECRIKDRFDRKALLAYEWDRSRVALDMKGMNVGLSGVSEFEAVRVEYKLRLQPEKTRREKCRYPSAWQGLLGSGYNEMFVREDKTVWQELQKVKQEARRFLGDAF